MAAKQTTSPLVWAILLLMLGAFVAFVLFLDQQIGKRGGAEQSKPAASVSETRPVIDFYEVLKNREVEILISDEDQAADETWHRVQLGPFASETKLSQARNLLIENQIKYMQRSAP